MAHITELIPHQKQIHQLAIPMVISSISVPLLGIVDTAILGHLASPVYLAAVNIGVMAINMLMWGLGFLRMSTTGLVAQSHGVDEAAATHHVFRAMALAGLLGGLLVATQQLVIPALLWLLADGGEAAVLADVYLGIRIWSAPAQLLLFVMYGYFLATKQTRKVLYLTLVNQVGNMVLDYVLVIHWGWHVDGVAWGSVVSEYLALLLGAYWLVRDLRSRPIQSPATSWLDLSQFRSLLQLNRDVFIRTLCLMAVFAFITKQSAKQGELVLAVNAVLLNFFYFTSYALDGYAHAIEAISGHFYGQKKWHALQTATRSVFIIAIIVALLLAAIFTVFGTQIIHALTHLESVRNGSQTYLWWVSLLPLVACFSFVYDGLCVGLTAGQVMRNSMLFATLCVFLPCWYLARWLLGDAVDTNHVLWGSFWVFFVARSLAIHRSVKQQWPGLSKQQA